MAGKKKMLFIINPRSGREQVKNKLLEILDIFVKAGYRIQVYVTQETKDAERTAAKEGARKDLIVCCGGDGTLNETISGMMKLASPPPLGYIPAGSTNDFAASLGLPRQLAKAAAAAAEGEEFAFDIGTFCLDRYFVYVAGFGLFTEVSYQTPQERKNMLGHQAYVLEGIKSLASIKSYEMRVAWDGGELEGEFIFGMITNTLSVGGFRGLVNQDVALDDGEFEVLLIRMPKTPIELSAIVSSLFLREEPDSDLVHKFRAGKVLVTSSEPVDWVLDGEFGGSRLEVEIENLQRRMTIRRPSAARQSPAGRIQR